MARRTADALLCTFAVALFVTAHASSVELPVRIDGGSLASTLKDLERQTGVELLYDVDVVREVHSPTIAGSLSAEAALRQMLAGTNLTVRRASSGAWIIERPTTPPLEQQDAAVAEILVVGRRTQNADIRRVENDVQPYVVATQAEIRRAHRDNVDQFLASRVTANTQVTPITWSQTGNTFSQVNLRGLGANDTLVLIDGRRMPSIPGASSNFDQPDLNGIPVHAIERIEVLTGAAGGIHGFGALGGVINVVLDRDTEGLELIATAGTTSRGDAGHRAFEASYGFDSDNGRTRLNVFGSYTEADRLREGQRDYAERDRRVTSRIAPDLYAGWNVVGNSVGVTPFGSLLELKPDYGGGVITSGFTFLPAGFSGDAAMLGATLREHDGMFDTSISAADAASDLGAIPHVRSLLFNVRHEFESGIEMYADAILWDSRARIANRTSGGTAFISPDSPVNPFTDFVTATFPIEGGTAETATSADSRRFTVGMLTDLPADWRGTIEAGIGDYSYRQVISSDLFVNSTLLLLGDPGDLNMNPFGDWTAFQSALTADAGSLSGVGTQRNRLESVTLRLAGPVFRMKAGPATLTLLAEQRREHVRATVFRASAELGGMTIDVSEPMPGRVSKSTSLYAEIRAPLIASDARFPLLRGLDVQLAVRRDDQSNNFVEDFLLTDEEEFVRLHPRFEDTAYTVGARIAPLPWLMLRASYATGEQPPLPDTLRISIDQQVPSVFAADPKRGDQLLGDDGPLHWMTGGNRDLRASRANTFFVGAVFTPFDDEGLTLAIDYSRIRRTRDFLNPTSQFILDHEQHWPERVTRAELTDDDRALGYTGGRVTALDARFMNGAGLQVEAVDARAEWPVSLLGGRMRFYAEATYHDKNRTTALLQSDIHNEGYLNGPLKWRANGGFDWSNDRVTVGANLQYFGSSLVYSYGTLLPSESELVIAQGSSRIPAQKYLDAHASWRIPLQNSGGVEEVGLDLGIINVLDTSPPRETTPFLTGPGYSRYGDPRRQRFELVLSCRF
jgi:outer membrane receptor protein involved in Fe transport